MNDEYIETVPCVHVGGGKWVPTDKVVFVDISEDIQGYDIMTFLYQGKELQSRIAMYPR